MIRHPQARRGQALVEFALILPFLAFFLMAIIEIGRAWNLKQVVTDASREGARFAVVYDPSVTAQQVIDSVLSKVERAGVNKAAVSVSFLASDGTAPSSGTPYQYFKTGTGQITTVEVAYKCNMDGAGNARPCFPVLNSVVGVLEAFLTPVAGVGGIGPIARLQVSRLHGITRMRNE
jgi:Flp pilus assembly protein TadG